MNPRLASLQPYPFQRLAALQQGISPPASLDPIMLSVGEPRHSPPGVITESLIGHLHGLAHYPLTRGSAELRRAIADWLQQRFDLANGVNPDQHVLPVNGTREALFAIAQCVVDPDADALVAMPNPFYQIYEGAALLAGARPHYLSCTEETGFVPDLDSVPDAVWQRCQLLYLCSPGNPTGAVMDQAHLQRAIQLAHRHDFLIASDECYSEIYLDEEAPPPGLLGAAERLGYTDFARCMAFHSLSKRSNAPGMRSGFVAGDPQIIDAFARYRTYHGCAMPPPHQAASTQAWRDEQHVLDNRALYRRKFDEVLEILDGVLAVDRPAAGFYLWPRTPVPDEAFARTLYAREHVTVLPGSYLARTVDGRNPGSHRVRMALVPSLEECVDAAQRIRRTASAL